MNQGSGGYYTLLEQRNWLATGPLSPTLMLFLEPRGKLYLKLHQVLAQLQVELNVPLASVARKRSASAKLKHGISPTEWSNVVRRVVENQESLRKVAKEYNVSYETVRRVLVAARQQYPVT